MHHRPRIAVVALAVAASIAAAAPQARGQQGDMFGVRTGMPDLTAGLARPDKNMRPRFPEPQNGSAAAGPRTAAPAPRAAPSFGGIMSEQQARDLVAAAGFKDVRPLQPGYHGNWTGYASERGRAIRVTVDPQGNVSAQPSYGSDRGRTVRVTVDPQGGPPTRR